MEGCDVTGFGTSLGAFGDSFYEYLLKTWLLNKNNETESRQMFDEAMRVIIDKLIKEYEGLTFVGYYCQVEDGTTPEIAPKMEQLACFSGGLFALASATLNSSLTQKYMDLAKKLTNTCHESYDKTTTKLGPATLRFNDDAEQSLKDDKTFTLKCQTIESYFILWRLTKDQKYKEWGWEALQAIEKNCRVDGGYTGIKNVFLSDSPKDDIQFHHQRHGSNIHPHERYSHNYFLGKTLKYLYLLYSHDSLISLDSWVFNTDGHPLPIKGSRFYRSEQ